MADQVAVVLYTNSSDECYQLATVTVCLQHLTVAIQHAKVVHSNTVKRVWKFARIRKWGPISYVTPRVENGTTEFLEYVSYSCSTITASCLRRTI